MNHHLRFAASPVIAAGISLCAPLLFTACSHQESEPPPKAEIALKSGEIRYRLHLFTTDEELGAPSAPPGIAKIIGAYPEEEGRKMLRQFQKDSHYHQDLSETAVGRKNQSVSISKTTDFRFPTEYDPPVINKPEDTRGVFPVTPATPVSFETTTLGTKANFKGKPVGKESLSVSFDLDKKALLGMVNYGTPITTQAKDFWGRDVEVIITENRIEVPVFRNSKIDTEVTLQNGQFILVHGSSGPLPDPPKTKGYKPNKNPTFNNSMSGAEKNNWVALIQVDAAP